MSGVSGVSGTRMGMGMGTQVEEECRCVHSPDCPRCCRHSLIGATKRAMSFLKSARPLRHTYLMMHRHL